MQIRVIRCTNAERVAYLGLEEGRICLETDTGNVYIGTSGGDVLIGPELPRWDPDALPDTPSAQDDQFDDESLDVKWTEWDLGAAQLTLAEADTFAILTHTNEAAERFRGIYQTLPAGDFTIATKASLISNVTADASVSICLFEDATNINADILVNKLLFRTAGNDWRRLLVQRWLDYQTHNADYAGGVLFPNTTCYLRIRRNGTNLYYEYGSDGVGWQLLFTHVQPFVPAHMGIVTSNANTGTTIYGYFDLFRYIASDQIGPIGKMI